MRQVLEDIGVDRFQMIRVKAPRERLFRKLADAVRGKGAFVPFNGGIGRRYPTACLIAAVNSSLVSSPST